MKTFLLHKLVRDKIVPSMQQSIDRSMIPVDSFMQVTELSGEELVKALLQKAHEELDELEVVIAEGDGSKKHKTDISVEIADLTETIEAIHKHGPGNMMEYTKPFQKRISEVFRIFDIDMKEVFDQKKAKFEEKGGFDKGYVIGELRLSPDNKWYDYFSKKGIHTKP